MLHKPETSAEETPREELLEDPLASDPAFRVLLELIDQEQERTAQLRAETNRLSRELNRDLAAARKRMARWQQEV